MVRAGVETFMGKGIEALHNNHPFLALACFEHAVDEADDLASCSYLAWCRAQTTGEHDEAIALAAQVLAMEPTNPCHYLNLGRIHRLAGNNGQAIELFRQGISYDASGEIATELATFGTRKPPLFPFLSRTHPVNRYLGLLFSQLGLR